MEKIKILYVSHFPDIKMGGQKSMYHIINNLDRDRFEPYCICPEPGELSEELEKIDCKCFFLPLFNIKPRNILKFHGMFSGIKKIISEYNIDIIHPDHSSDAFFSGLAKRGTKCKMVWHIRWNEKHPKDRIHERLADGIIGVSDASIQRFSGTAEFMNKYRTIYNGVDCELFKPVDDIDKLHSELGMPDEKFILLFVGILKEGKGIFEILDALNIIKKDGKYMPFTFFIGTWPSDEIKDRFYSKADENDLRDDIKILPHQNEIYRWMQAADVLLIPSHEGNEGMPRVLYEAMACGTTGIGSDTSGVREAVTEDSGLLVNEKSPEELAAAIQKLMDNPELLQKLQIGGRQRALNHFEVKSQTKKIEKFYYKILEINDANSDT